MSKKKVKPSRSQLIASIQNLLQKDFVETQEELRIALHRQGFEVNQVMISRVLNKLGAVKLNEGERVVYRLPTELLAMTPKNSLNQLVLSILSNEMLIVVRTVPGSAQLVARLLDQQKQIGILGTVAGDDTVFIAPESLKKIQETLKKVSDILLG